MKQRISLTLPYPPSLNRMYRTVNGRMLISKEGRGYKDAVGAICMANRIHPFSVNDIRVTVNAYRPQKRGDLDNLFKGLFDAANGRLWRDDSQIAEILAFRFDDKRDPRIELTVEEI